jgi:hypothetical protein
LKHVHGVKALESLLAHHIYQTDRAEKRWQGNDGNKRSLGHGRIIQIRQGTRPAATKISKLIA